jgi:hypothetical protein
VIRRAKCAFRKELAQWPSAAQRKRPGPASRRGGACQRSTSRCGTAAKFYCDHTGMGNVDRQDHSRVLVAARRGGRSEQVEALAGSCQSAGLSPASTACRRRPPTSRSGSVESRYRGDARARRQGRRNARFRGDGAFHLTLICGSFVREPMSRWRPLELVRRYAAEAGRLGASRKRRFRRCALGASIPSPSIPETCVRRPVHGQFLPPASSRWCGATCLVFSMSGFCGLANARKPAEAG